MSTSTRRKKRVILKEVKEKEEDTGIYEVEYIFGKEMMKDGSKGGNEMFYFIKWHQFPMNECTWENEIDIFHTSSIMVFEDKCSKLNFYRIRQTLLNMRDKIMNGSQNGKMNIPIFNDENEDKLLEILSKRSNKKTKLKITAMESVENFCPLKNRQISIDFLLPSQSQWNSSKQLFTLKSLLPFISSIDLLDFLYNSSILCK